MSICIIGVQELTNKKLEEKSIYESVDANKDGVITNLEMETHHRIMLAKKEALQIDNAEKMLDQQRYLCWVSSISSIGLLLLLLTPVIALERVEMVTALLSTYVVANVGIFASFVMATAWSRKNGKVNNGN